MRKQWKWPWVSWLKLITCQLVVRLIKTIVADITLFCLMKNINNLVVLWNILRHENKHEPRKEFGEFLLGFFFFLFFLFSVLSQPWHFYQIKVKKNHIRICLNPRSLYPSKVGNFNAMHLRSCLLKCKVKGHISRQVASAFLSLDKVERKAAFTQGDGTGFELKALKTCIIARS